MRNMVNGWVAGCFFYRFCPERTRSGVKKERVPFILPPVCAIFAAETRNIHFLFGMEYMERITDFGGLTTRLADLGRRLTVAVVCGTDESTRDAVSWAVKDGFVEAVFVGGGADMTDAETAPYVRDVAAADDTDAARQAVAMVREGKADVLMKGMVGTDVLLRAVLDKQSGLLPPGGVLTHLAVAEVPGYERLLFMTDVAVIPYPDAVQRRAQVDCAVRTCRAMGIDVPRVALVHCSEKASDKFPHTLDYLEMKREAAGGRWGDIVLDGPLDVRTACDAEALRLKGIESPVEGRADVLVFPDIEAGNTFYKTMTFFAHASTAGMLQGAMSPVVLPSRGDTAVSKYYSLALAVVGAAAEKEAGH